MGKKSKARKKEAKARQPSTRRGSKPNSRPASRPSSSPGSAAPSRAASPLPPSSRAPSPPPPPPPAKRKSAPEIAAAAAPHKQREHELKERAYNGVVLRWPETFSAASWQRVPKLLAWLEQRLSQLVGLKLGVALRQDAVGPDLTQLAASLGPASLFLLPPDMPPSKYQGTAISYFSESTLNQLWQLYNRYFRPGVGNISGLDKSACYLLPADTYTFKVARVADRVPAPGEQSLGPGVEGNVTRKAGRMAYFESCQLVAASYTKLTLPYGVVAARLDSWVSYTEPQLLAAFLEHLHENVSATCMGLWNPHWDDFGALCGPETYPLAGAVFRHFNDTH